MHSVKPPNHLARIEGCELMKIMMSVREFENNKGFLQDIKQFFFNVAKLSILESYQDDGELFLVFSDKIDEVPIGVRRISLTFFIEATTDEEVKKEKEELRRIMGEIDLLVSDAEST